VKFSENRLVAWIVLALCVVVGTVVLGGLSIREERQGAIEAFYNGSGDAYFSLNSYMDRRADAAGKLANLAFACLGENDADARQLSDAVGAVRAAGGPNEKIAADRAVTAAADALYARIAASTSIGEENLRDAKILYADLTDAAGKMRGDEYSRVAQWFNGILDGFPASLLAALFGIEPLEVIV